MNGWEAESDAPTVKRSGYWKPISYYKYLKDANRCGKGKGTACAGIVRQPGYPAARRADQPTLLTWMPLGWLARISDLALRILLSLYPMTVIS